MKADQGEQGCGDEQCEVDRFAGRRERRGQNVRIEVAEQQHKLEEDQAGHPDGRGAAEDGQQLLGGEGLDEEEQEAPQKTVMP